MASDLLDVSLHFYRVANPDRSVGVLSYEPEMKRMRQVAGQVMFCLNSLSLEIIIYRRAQFEELQLTSYDL